MIQKIQIITIPTTKSLHTKPLRFIKSLRFFGDFYIPSNRYAFLVTFIYLQIVTIFSVAFFL